MKKSLLSLAFAVGLVCSAALAQDPQTKPANQTPVVDKREQVQKQRIKQGVKSGELTKKETRRLAAEQKKIKHDEAKAKADGKVTPRERRKLKREENRASKDIYRQKHDAQKRKQ